MAASALAIGVSMPSAAQEPSPDIPPIDAYTVLIETKSGTPVMRMDAAPRDPFDSIPPIVSTGTLGLTPKLCRGDLRIRFIATGVTGKVAEYVYSAAVSASSGDGRRARCPLQGMPRRGLTAVTGNLLLTTPCDTGRRRAFTFDATPAAGTADPFGDLRVGRLAFNCFNVPSSRARLQVGLRYGARTRAVVYRMMLKVPRQAT